MSQGLHNGPYSSSANEDQQSCPNFARLFEEWRSYTRGCTRTVSKKFTNMNRNGPLNAVIYFGEGILLMKRVEN